MSGPTQAEFIDCKKSFRNHFNLTQYDCHTRFFHDDGQDILPVAVGYGIIVVFGLVFGVCTVGLVLIEQYLFGRKMDSEFFNTAGRSVKTGLTASVIVSQWTWAATLLQSSTTAYKYGISGPFWYASGATVQIILFSLLAVLVKLRAPTCHTFLEIIRARWGTAAHIVFGVFALLTNIIVTAMLILGGSAVVKAVTGVPTNVSAFLIPLGVILYTLAGGLKATFVASYFNTALIMIALVIFVFKVYAFGDGDQLGSPAKVYDALEEVATIEAVENNRGGSYLTMLSLNGFFFGLVNIVGNFGTVFVDQAYWQSAIAATPSASWKGYLLGGLCWFAIPFTLATSLGLAAVAQSLPITLDEAEKGLVPPAVAHHLMGKGGSVLILIMLFMAVTSSGAAEQIAISSLVAYDIYRTYIDRNCSGTTIIRVSRICILIFGIVMGGVVVAFHEWHVNLNWLYLAMGVFIGPAVVPVAFSISWGRASGKGAIAGAVLGLIIGVSTWLGYASRSGGISIKSTGKDEVMLVGNLTSIVSSGLITTIVSFIYPDDCDWSTTRAIPLVEDDPNAHISFETEESLRNALKKIAVYGVSIAFILVVLWPALTAPVRVFSKAYFTFWVILSMIWGLVATLILLFLPIWESRHEILVTLTWGAYTPRVTKDKIDRLEQEEDEEDGDFVVDER